MAASAAAFPSRGWCFTWNNPPEDWAETMEAIAREGAYVVVGEEVAPSSGTRHLQGYVYWQRQRAFNTMRAFIPNAHWEGAKGNPVQNYKYCTKDGKFIEFGINQRPASIGGRSKPKEKPNLFQLCADGRTEAELCAEGIITTNSQLRFFRELGGMVCRDFFSGERGILRRQRPIDFVWVTGPPGAGKSDWIYDNVLSHGSAPHKRYVGFPSWWGSIQDLGPTPTVWFEELHDLSAKDFATFVTMFDRGCSDVEVKGGHASFRPKMVIVTSTTAPADLALSWSHDRRTHLQAIVRRLTDHYIVVPTRNPQGHIIDREYRRVRDPMEHYGFYSRHMEVGVRRVGEGDGYPAGGWACASASYHPRSLPGDHHDGSVPMGGMDVGGRGRTDEQVDAIAAVRVLNNGRVICLDELDRVSGVVGEERVHESDEDDEDEGSDAPDDEVLEVDDDGET